MLNQSDTQKRSTEISEQAEQARQPYVRPTVETLVLESTHGKLSLTAESANPFTGS